jgi:hypothetical protein
MWFINLVLEFSLCTKISQNFVLGFKKPFLQGEIFGTLKTLSVLAPQNHKVILRVLKIRLLRIFMITRKRG